MISLVAGVDEVGRGPLAGPVLAAAVILNPQRPIEGLKDSKQLTPKARAYLFECIKEHALAWAVGRAEVEEIDKLNILRASLLAMERAIEALPLFPTFVEVDGIHLPKTPCEARSIVQGDKLIPAISAASILAKETRDAEMMELHEEYPLYGFNQHKGYPTKVHLMALEKHGVTKVHRKSFGPVKRLLIPV